MWLPACGVDVALPESSGVKPLNYLNRAPSATRLTEMLMPLAQGQGCQVGSESSPDALGFFAISLLRFGTRPDSKLEKLENWTR